MNAIKKVWIYISEHGYAFMLAGMVVVIAAAILLVRYRQGGESPAPFVWPIAVIGLIIYILGRLGTMHKNRRRQKLDIVEKSDSHS